MIPIPNDEAFANWDGARGIAFLMIYDAFDPASTAQEIFDYYTNQSPLVEGPHDDLHLFFEFRDWDCRFNSVESMLCTFLAEIAHGSLYVRGSLADFVETAKNNHWWNLEDLFALCFDTFTSVDLFRSRESVVWILANLDERIKSSSWLLSKLENLAKSSDWNLKVVVANWSGSTWASNSACFQRTTMCEKQEYEQPSPEEVPMTAVGSASDKKKNSPVPENEIADRVDIEALELIQEKPGLYSVGPQLSRLLSQCKPDSELLHLIIAWFRTRDANASPPQVEEDISELMPLSPDKAFHRIVMPLFEDSETKKAAGELLDLILFSFRPFSIHELADLGPRTSFLPTARALLGTLPQEHLEDSSPYHVLLRIHQDEIHFRHRLFRGLFLSEKSADGANCFTPKRVALAHARIAAVCLEYLSSADSLDHLMHQASLQSTLYIESRLTFHSYAVTFWPKHVRLAGAEALHQVGPLERFLRDENALNLWTKAYRNHSNPITRDAHSGISPLWIFAEHGLETLLEVTVDKYRGTRFFEAECLSALEAAARSGDIRMVRRTLSLPLTNNQTLDKILMAALDSGNEEVVRELLSKASTHPSILTDPSAAFCRAASLRSSSLAKMILSQMTSSRSTIVLSQDCLVSACKGGDLTIVRTVLDKKSEEADAPMGEKNRIFQGLLTAGKYDQHAVVAFLADIEIAASTSECKDGPAVTKDDKDVLAEMLSRALETAVDVGRFRVLRALLDTISARLNISKIFPNLIERAISCEIPLCLKELLLSLRQTELEANGLGVEPLEEKPIEGPNEPVSPDSTTVRGCLNMQEFSRFLVQAVERGGAAFELTKLLLEENPGRPSQEDYTAALTTTIIRAVGKNDGKIASLLLEKGLDLETRNGGYDRTFLFQAAYCGSTDVVELLINARADPNAKDDDGWSPIHAAYDNATSVRLLIEAGADVNAKTNDGSTSLLFASQYRNEEVVEELLRHNPELNCFVAGITELSSPVAYGNKNIVKMLLDAGADPCKHSPEELSDPLLHLCVRGSQTEVLKLLLCYNFQLDETGRDGDAALHWIDSDTDVEVLKPLINRGASLNIVNGAKETPLAIAVLYDNIKAAAFLISKGANVNAQCGYRGALLHIACYQSTLTMIDLLINNGADTNLADQGLYGTPFQAACQRSWAKRKIKSEVLSHLVQAEKLDVKRSSDRWGCNLNTACLMTDLEVVNTLLNRGADPNVEDKMGRRPIHFALYRTLNLVKRLLEAGADLLGKDLMQRNALHFAVVSGRLDVVEFVLERCEELVDQKDIDGWTPLFWAIRKCIFWNTQTDERVEIIRLLIRRGASVMTQGEGLDREWTPWRLADYYGMENEIVELVSPPKEEIEKSEDKTLWQRNGLLDPAPHGYQTMYCSACLMVCGPCNTSARLCMRIYMATDNRQVCVGVYYSCDICEEFHLCFKCYRSKNLVHPKHAFNSKGEDDGPTVASSDDYLSESETEDSNGAEGAEHNVDGEVEVEGELVENEREQGEEGKRKKIGEG